MRAQAPHKTGVTQWQVLTAAASTKARLSTLGSVCTSKESKSVKKKKFCSEKRVVSSSGKRLAHGLTNHRQMRADTDVKSELKTSWYSLDNARKSTCGSNESWRSKMRWRSAAFSLESQRSRPWLLRTEKIWYSSWRIEAVKVRIVDEVQNNHPSSLVCIKMQKDEMKDSWIFTVIAWMLSVRFNQTQKRRKM